MGRPKKIRPVGKKIEEPKGPVFLNDISFVDYFELDEKDISPFYSKNGYGEIRNNLKTIKRQIFKEECPGRLEVKENWDNPFYGVDID